MPVTPEKKEDYNRKHYQKRVGGEPVRKYVKAKHAPPPEPEVVPEPDTSESRASEKKRLPPPPQPPTSLASQAMKIAGGLLTTFLITAIKRAAMKTASEVATEQQKPSTYGLDIAYPSS